MIKSRKYDQCIELLYEQCVEDAFGKNESTKTFDMLKTFAHVRQTHSDRVKFQITEAQESAYRFTFRYTRMKFNVIRWKGERYVVNSIDNVDEQNRELVVYAQKMK